MSALIEIKIKFWKSFCNIRKINQRTFYLIFWGLKKSIGPKEPFKSSLSAPWLLVREKNCKSFYSTRFSHPGHIWRRKSFLVKLNFYNLIGDRGGAFTTRWQHWYQMKSCLFLFLMHNFFSKQNEKAFIRDQYCHLAGDGSPFVLISKPFVLVLL